MDSTSLTPFDDPAWDIPLRPCRGTAPVAPYGVPEARAAWSAWGANCGPWALAAVTGCPLDDVRAWLPAFARRPYTKETDMRAALDAAGLSWSEHREGWPRFGLVRVLWHGPWWHDPDPFARLRRSHWVATIDAEDGRWIFDGNAIALGGWVRPEDWSRLWAPYVAGLGGEGGTSGAWRAHERFEIPPPA